MKRKIYNILCIFIVCIMVFESLGQKTTVLADRCINLPVKGSYDYITAQYILKYTNKERTKRGLSKLKLDKSLTKAAMIRACELSVYISEKHLRPNGKDRASLNRKINWENTLEIGEYVSRGVEKKYYKKLAKKIVKAWMDSPSHREGILKRNFKSIGIGVFQGHSITYASQEFSSYGAGKICKKNKHGKDKYYKVSTLKKYLVKKYFDFHIAYNNELRAGDKEELHIVHLNPYFKEMEVVVNPKVFKITSSNNKIATVNRKGVIKGKKEGTVMIKVVYKRNPKVVIKKKIKVY